MCLLQGTRRAWLGVRRPQASMPMCPRPLLVSSDKELATPELGTALMPQLGSRPSLRPQRGAMQDFAAYDALRVAWQLGMTSTSEGTRNSRVTWRPARMKNRIGMWLEGVSSLV